MAVGDKFMDLQTVADGASLLAQPTSGVEATVHNITYDAGSIEIYYPADGVIDLLYDTDTDSGGRLAYAWHVTDALYLRIKNTSGGSVIIGYSGVVTKE